MLGPHIFGVSPVTRSISAQTVRASARRAGLSTASRNPSTVASVGLVLFTATTELPSPQVKELRESIMVATRQHLERLRVLLPRHPVHQLMLSRDPPRPPAAQLPSQWFRLAGAAE